MLQIKGSLTSLCLSFAAGQVNQIQFGGPDVFLPAVVRLAALEVYSEDGVTAGGVCIHQRSTDWTVLPPALHHSLTVRHVLAWVHRQTYDCTTNMTLTFVDIKLCLWSDAGLVGQSEYRYTSQCQIRAAPCWVTSNTHLFTSPIPDHYVQTWRHQ